MQVRASENEAMSEQTKKGENDFTTDALVTDLVQVSKMGAHGACVCVCTRQLTE